MMASILLMVPAYGGGKSLSGVVNHIGYKGIGHWWLRKGDVVDGEGDGVTIFIKGDSI